MSEQNGAPRVENRFRSFLISAFLVLVIAGAGTAAAYQWNALQPDNAATASSCATTAAHAGDAYATGMGSGCAIAKGAIVAPENTGGCPFTAGPSAVATTADPGATPSVDPDGCLVDESTDSHGGVCTEKHDGETEASAEVEVPQA